MAFEGNLKALKGGKEWLHGGMTMEAKMCRKVLFQWTGNQN